MKIEKLDPRIPRDREGTFDLTLIACYQRRFPGVGVAQEDEPSGAHRIQPLGAPR